MRRILGGIYRNWAYRPRSRRLYSRHTGRGQGGYTHGIQAVVKEDDLCRAIPGLVNKEVARVGVAVDFPGPENHVAVQFGEP